MADGQLTITGSNAVLEDGQVVEMVDISGCEIEIAPEEDSTDQQLLQQEIKEEELEDAEVSQDISQQGKRLLLKDWLIQKLNSGEHSNILSWYDKSQGLFRIKWLHKATDSWEVVSDGVLFKEWCIHTGKYDPKHENPRKWKANFRCALNSLPDVIIVPPLCVRKGKDAYRVFKILPEKIPEKVREKQESSRKRRREKRESLLKAYAKNQEELGNVEEAKAITEQLAVNSSHIKIHLKRTPYAPQKYQSLLTMPLMLASSKAYKSTASTTTTTTSSGGKTLLNGMDALCTAAAMMADKPGEEEGVDVEVTQEPGDDDNEVTQATEIIVGDEPVLKNPKICDVANAGLPVVCTGPSQSSGDVVTYYRPVGPIHVSDSQNKPTSVVTVKPAGSNDLPFTVALTTVTTAATTLAATAPAATTASIPVFKSINPLKLGSASISTSTGNVLLSVRLANPSSTSASTATPTKIIQQGVPIPHLAGFPSGVCIQPFSPTTTSTASQSPAYLIPKTFLQQQVAASAGNQPARVYTVKPAKIEGAYAKLNETTINQKARSISSLRMAPMNVDYSQLKASIFNALEKGEENKDLGFQLCKNTELIRAVRIYDSDKPTVEVSLTVQTDFTFTIVVHNRNLPSAHEILRKNSKTIKSEFQFKQLLERIGMYITCIGNPEEMAHRNYTDYSAFISAFQEPDLGAKNPILRYHSTIRSNGCHLLIRAPEETLCNTLSEDQVRDCYRCDECSRIRTQALSMRGLFSLLDGSKVPDTEPARRKRLQLLKDYTTKEVLANRVDVLETQIKRYQQLLPDKLDAIEPVTAVTVTAVDSPTPSESSTMTTAGHTMQDNSTQYVTSISESLHDGEVQNVIRVTLSDNDITGGLPNVDDVVYTNMVVPVANSTDDIMLVDTADGMQTGDHTLLY